MVASIWILSLSTFLLSTTFHKVDLREVFSGLAFIVTVMSSSIFSLLLSTLPITRYPFWVLMLDE